MRFIGMDIHRDFCEIAIAETDGQVRSAGRVNSLLEELEPSISTRPAAALAASSTTMEAGSTYPEREHRP